jgi:NitT/TauT family transport system permease protein
VWARIREWIQDGSLLEHIGATLGVLVTGFAVATVLGVALGVLICVSDWAYDILEPFLMFFNGMPRLILQPFFVVWLGFGFAAKTSLVVAVIIIMVVVTFVTAFREIDRDIVSNTKLLGAGPAHMMLHVYAPALALALVSSARTTLGFALQATLVSEFVGAAGGLGYLIVKGQQTFDVSTIWAALAVVVVLAMILDAVVAAFERYATRWLPAPA